MSVPKLGTSGQEVVDVASRLMVQSTFAALDNHFQAHNWVDNNNRYRSKVVETLKSDHNNGTSVDDASLAEYIAASAPLHCADSWSLIGRALTCHAQGDGDGARHFAYYAELRGAASLLATEGIGIFSGLHYALKSSGECVRIPCEPGTHRAAWQLLEYWSGLERAANLISEIVSPAGVPLAIWLDAFRPGTTVLPIGSDWLKSWGLDLQRLSEDRDAREEASYRPTRLVSRASLDGFDSASFIQGLWNLHEPFPFSRFEFLDRHLLRISLELVSRSITGGFNAGVEAAIRTISPVSLPQAEWKRFLTRATEPSTPELIKEAGNNVPVTDPRHHVQVIARATLLLRVATGACAQLLESSSIGRKELEFWWKSLGEDRGLWEPGDEPDDLTELWPDVEEELDNAAEWKTANASGASIRR